MLSIVQGRHEHLQAHCLSLADASARPLWLQRQPGPLRSWDGLRDLLVQLEELVGRDAVDSVLRRDVAAAGLVVERFHATDDTRQLRRRSTLAADLTSHLTHNRAFHQPLLDAWGALLPALLDLARAHESAPSSVDARHLLVPDLGLLDRQSLSVLLAAVQSAPERLPPLTLGYDPRRQTRRSAEGLLLERGWSDWLVPLDRFRALASGEETLLSDSSVHDRDLGSQAATRPDGSVDSRRVDEAVFDALESRAAHRLADESLDRDGASLAAEAVRRAFANLGFGAAIRLGNALLAHRPSLSAEEAADVHSILALACHDRQFKTVHASPDLTRFMERHLRAALALEPRRDHRCALLYRLSVLLGRRQKQFKLAMAPADEAVALASQAAAQSPSGKASTDDARTAAYQEAWALNIRSFLHFRTGAVDRGVEDADRALSLLSDLRIAQTESIDSTEDRWPRDITFSQAVVAHNRANLSQYLGDPAAADRLRALANEIDADFTGVETVEAMHWVGTHRAAGELGRAIERALGGLESARGEKDPWSEFFYLTLLGDLALRRGAPADAARRFAAARALRARLGDPPYLQALELPHAQALALSGTAREARDLYRAALDALDPDRAEIHDQRAELLSALGLLAARERRDDAVEPLFDQAIDAAVASGALVTLVRTAVAAGQAYRLMERLADARAAFEQADGLLAEGDEIPVSDRFALWIGLLSSGAVPADAGQGGFETSLAVRALNALPQALTEATTWLELPHLSAWLEHRPQVLDAAAPEAVALYRIAVEEQRRPDTEA